MLLDTVASQESHVAYDKVQHNGTPMQKIYVLYILHTGNTSVLNLRHAFLTLWLYDDGIVIITSNYFRCLSGCGFWFVRMINWAKKEFTCQLQFLQLN